MTQMGKFGAFGNVSVVRDHIPCRRDPVAVFQKNTVERQLSEYHRWSDFDERTGSCIVPLHYSHDASRAL